jgi:hypothetical protein
MNILALGVIMVWKAAAKMRRECIDLATIMPPATITMSMLTVSGMALMFAPRWVHFVANFSLGSAYKLAQIMLRNIPNKVDQAMLKRIVDESSWGKYDFMYLRIDFANDCKWVCTLRDCWWMITDSLI